MQGHDTSNVNARKIGRTENIQTIMGPRMGTPLGGRYHDGNASVDYEQPSRSVVPFLSTSFGAPSHVHPGGGGANTTRNLAPRSSPYALREEAFTPNNPGALPRFHHPRSLPGGVRDVMETQEPGGHLIHEDFGAHIQFRPQDIQSTSSTSYSYTRTAMPARPLPHPRAPRMVQPTSHSGRPHAGSDNSNIPTVNLANNNTVLAFDYASGQFGRRRNSVAPQNHDHNPRHTDIPKGRRPPSSFGGRHAPYLVPSSSREDIRASSKHHVVRVDSRIHLSMRSGRSTHADEDGGPYYDRHPLPGYYASNSDTKSNVTSIQQLQVSVAGHADGSASATDARIKGVERAFPPPYPENDPSPGDYFDAVDSRESPIRTTSADTFDSRSHSQVIIKEANEVVRFQTSPPMWSLQALAKDADDCPLVLGGANHARGGSDGVFNSSKSANPNSSMHGTAPPSAFSLVLAESVYVEIHGYGTLNTTHGNHNSARGIDSASSTHANDRRMRGIREVQP